MVIRIFKFYLNFFYIIIDLLRRGAVYRLVRATPTGVAIKGAIPVTAKMAPKSLKAMLQWRWHRRWQNAIRDVGVPYLATLKRDAGGCKIAVDGSCASQRLSQRLYPISISIKTQRFKGEMSLSNPCLRNPRTEQTLASLKYCPNPSPYCRVEREEEEERKKEEEEERKKEEKSQSRLKEEEDRKKEEEREEPFEGRKVFLL